MNPGMLAISQVVTVYLAAGAFLVFRAWRGWRLGPVRQGVGLGALLLGIAGGMFLGGTAAPLFRTLGFPDPVLAVVGGVAVGVGIYIGILSVSAVLFKSTGDQDFALIRFGYGLAGMVMGLAVGVVFLGAALVGVRVSGAVLEGRASARPGRAASGGLVELRAGLESGFLGGLLRWVDPVSEEVYAVLVKAGQVTATPAGMQRFLSNPEWKRVLGDRRLQELQRDPVLVREILEGRFVEVLRNPRVVGMVNDVELRGRLGGVDLEKALDYALSKPEKGASRLNPKRP